MMPLSIGLGGGYLEIWDLLLLVGLVAGYPVLRRSFSPEPPRALLIRYLAVAYVAVLAAQLFSYAFDYGTQLVAPPGYSRLYYYLSPTAGAKTLYGAILALPLGVAVFFSPAQRRRWHGTMGLADRFTPALLVVVCLARVGCFLQGCCYGVVSEHFGIRFVTGSVVYHDHLRRGLVEAGSPSLAVVPTQVIAAAVLALLALWAYRRVQRGQTQVFAHSVALYSLFRFAIEWVRDDAVRNHFGPLATSQWIAVFVLLVYSLSQLRRRSASRASERGLRP